MKTDPTIYINVTTCIISMIVFFFNWRNNRISLKTKLIDEIISLNTITIEYPILRLVYEPEDEVKKKNLSTENEERLKSFCYKYLNLLDLMNTHYSVTKYNLSNNRIDKEIKKESHLGGWFNFYSKTFKKGTKGYAIMVLILNNAKQSGDYSDKFVLFAKELLSID